MKTQIRRVLAVLLAVLMLLNSDSFVLASETIGLSFANETVEESIDAVGSAATTEQEAEVEAAKAEEDNQAAEQESEEPEEEDKQAKEAVEDDTLTQSDSSEKESGKTAAEEETTAAEETVAEESTAEEKAAEESAGEETSAAEETAVEESVAENTPVENEGGEAVSEPETEVSADSVKVTAVFGEDNTPISAEYTDIIVPVETDMIDLTKSLIDGDVTRAAAVEGTNRLYVESFVYAYATVGNAKVTSLARADIKEDTVVLLHYTNDQTKTKYVYEDGDVKVTAEVKDPSAIPDDAEFKVTPITVKNHKDAFESYLGALNENADALTAQKGELDKKEFTKENTLLYDIAFLAQKSDENGNPIADQKVEVQPAEGSVEITFNFKKKQLKKIIGAESVEDISVIHLPLNDTVVSDADKSVDVEKIQEKDVEVEPVQDATTASSLNKVEFTLDSFSIVAISTHPSIYRDTDQTNSQVNFKLATGRAVEYGIVADTYDQKNHQQTNFAVKHFKNSGEINGEPDLSGTHDVPYQIGSIDLNKLRFGTNTYQGKAVQYDVYLPKSYESNINNYVQIDGGGKDTVNIVYEIRTPSTITSLP